MGNSPTDAELWQLYMQQPGQHKDPIDFARAALAKRGQSSGAGEPFCYVSVNKQGDITRTIKRKDKWTNIPLYTTPQPTQPQAGAVPLTPEQIKAMDRRHPAEDLCGWSYRLGIADAEAHHGIKGGQHGTE